MSSTKKRGHRRKIVDSWKEKKWYNIYAPLSFKNQYIGQIPSADPSNLIGRTIWTRLHEFTKDFKHTHIKLRFKIIKANEVGTSCETRFQGSELTRDYIRALIHRGSTRIDGIFNYKTADGFIYRVDAFCVTKRRAKGSQKLTIRRIIFQVLNEFAKSSKHGKFERGLIYGVYAENITKIVKTIYPLKECQILKVKLISSPEDIVEEEYNEEETFEVQSVELKTHGKQIKAIKKARKAAQKAVMKNGRDETAETAESDDIMPTDDIEKTEDESSEE